MRTLRKRTFMAVTVLVVFAATSVAVFAQEASAGGPGEIASLAGQAPAQASLAEQYLSRLAAKSERQRKLGGGISLGLGALCAAGGIAMLGEEDDWLGLNKAFGTGGVIMGGIGFAGGILALSIPSPAERAFKRIRPIEDPAQRERACADALADLAKTGRRARMIGGAVTCATGAACALLIDREAGTNGYWMIAASTASLALVQFLVKSQAERTYRAFLEQGGVKPVPDLVLGIGPRGSLRAGLSLAF